MPSIEEQNKAVQDKYEQRNVDAGLNPDGSEPERQSDVVGEVESQPDEEVTTTDVTGSFDVAEVPAVNAAGDEDDI